MELLTTLLSQLTDKTLSQAIVLLILLLVFLRLFVPTIFDFRTRIQKSLEETYEAHITELKEMIDTYSSTADTLQQKLVSQDRKLMSISAKLTVLGRIIEEYNCKKAIDCVHREHLGKDVMSLLEHSVCDDCTADCNECDYMNMLADRRKDADVF